MFMSKLDSITIHINQSLTGMSWVLVILSHLKGVSTLVPEIKLALKFNFISRGIHMSGIKIVTLCPFIHPLLVFFGDKFQVCQKNSG